MPRRKTAPLAQAFDLARLGFEAWTVMALRSAKLAAGGPAATLEAQRMMAEKSTAMLEAQFAAGLALASGASRDAAGRKALGCHRRRVKANPRRLLRKG